MGNLALDRLVERRMRTWELGSAQRPAKPALTTQRIHPYIAVTRTLGSGGREMADRLGELLEWPVYDKEILDYMADNDDVQRRLYASVDERTASWLEAMIAPFRAEAPRPRDDFFRKLVRAIRTIASHGSAIFVGRGAGFILPADRGLHVRVVAPMAHCAESYAARIGCSIPEATEIILETTAARASFLRDRFGDDAVTEARYDLMINAERFPPIQAAKLIVEALRSTTSWCNHVTMQPLQ